MGEVRQTRATSAYAALRETIIAGDIKPGSKLNIRALSERLDISLSPMREALNRLSSEGLVTHSDQRGFTVTGLDIQELAELTRARCWINEIGLRNSIAHGGDQWEEDLLLAYHRMNRIPRLTEDRFARAPAWAKAHMHFHRTLIAASGSIWITRYCDQLFEAAERYRLAARHAERPRTDVASEHEAILNAAIKRDADQAVALLNAHFDRTASLVHQTLQPVPITGGTQS